MVTGLCSLEVPSERLINDLGNGQVVESCLLPDYVYPLSDLAAVPTSTALVPALPVDIRCTLGGLSRDCQGEGAGGNPNDGALRCLSPRRSGPISSANTHTWCHWKNSRRSFLPCDGALFPSAARSSSAASGWCVYARGIFAYRPTTADGEERLQGLEILADVAVPTSTALMPALPVDYRCT